MGIMFTNTNLFPMVKEVGGGWWRKLVVEGGGGTMNVVDYFLLRLV